jgi:uncharacterized protein YqgV (UPF0045/DUF77 family)
MSTECSAEFFVEPFEIGRPGTHVEAAFDAVRRLGLTLEIGPFGSTIRGEPHLVMQAVKDLLDAATRAGATRVSVQVEVCGG